MEHDKRQVIRIRDVSPDVLIVDDSQVGRAWDSQRPAVCVSSGKRMPGKVSTAISQAPPSLDLTVICTSRVATTPVQPPAVTSDPAMSTATVTSREVEISLGTSDVAPVPRSKPNSILVGKGLPTFKHSSPPLSEPPDPGPVVSPLSGQSSYVSARMLVWCEAGDSSVPLSPNCVQAGHFRTRAVSSMCRRFCQDFCFGH